MKNGFVTLTALVAFASTGSYAFAGDKYVGKWDEQVNTSLEIVSKTRVTYCYDGGCNRLKFKGTLDEMTFTFPKNGSFSGATMTMRKDGDTYLGEYELNGSARIAVVTLVKQ